MKKKIRFLAQIAGWYGAYSIGQVAEVKKEQADALIKSGYAEMMETSPIETTDMPAAATEAAVSRKKKK